ncbi:ADP-ribose 1''-phosphate phosphatase [Schizophyllum commune]
MLPAPSPVPSDASNASTLVYTTGDIFSAPPGSILVHACNTKGAWGSGIAAAFKERFPRAFVVYQAYCKEYGASALGMCLLIPDVDGRGHEIACLFTSKAYGKRKDGPEEILQATRSALSDLVNKNVEGKELHGCKFNSGRFSVPWKDTDSVFSRTWVLE